MNSNSFQQRLLGLQDNLVNLIYNYLTICK